MGTGSPDVVRMENVRGRGLGLPLPQGGVAVFEEHGGRPMLVGEGAMADTAVGEDVEIAIGESADVQVLQRLAGGGDGDDIDYDKPQRFEIEISNANPRPVEVETYLRVAQNFEIVRPSRKLKIKNGRRMWPARIGANDRAVLAYTVRPLPSPDRGDDEDDDEDQDDDEDEDQDQDD